MAQALALLNAGDAVAASELCQKLLAAAPRDPALLQLGAAIALRQGDAEAARRQAAAALAVRPDHAPTLLIAGHAARALNDPKEALAFFRRASTRDPARAEPAFMTCIVLLELGDGEARTMLDFCLETFPADAPGWRAIGVAMERAGQQEAALAAFTRAARAAPSCELDMRRGAILRALGRQAEALAAFRAARALAPQHFDAALQLGLALQSQGDVAGARAALEEAAALAPNDARGWFALGLLAQENRDWPAAIAAYRQALAADRNLAEAAVNLGVVLQETGDLAAARAAYGEALALRADTLGRIAQALTAAPRGELWLDLAALRSSLAR
jgi:tetratricopeptide (TPR) repeat protein